MHIKHFVHNTLITFVFNTVTSPECISTIDYTIDIIDKKWKWRLFHLATSRNSITLFYYTHYDKLYTIIHNNIIHNIIMCIAGTACPVILCRHLSKVRCRVFSSGGQCASQHQGTALSSSVPVGTRRAVSPVVCRAVGTSVVVVVGKLHVWPVAVSALSRSVLVSVSQAVCTRLGVPVQQSCSVGCASSLPGCSFLHLTGTHSTCVQGIAR